jgi:hypothetical protein
MTLFRIFMAWWRLPPMRARILAAVGNEWMTVKQIHRIVLPWNVGAMLVELNRLSISGHLARRRITGGTGQCEYRRGVRR